MSAMEGGKKQVSLLAVSIRRRIIISWWRHL